MYIGVLQITHTDTFPANANIIAAAQISHTDTSCANADITATTKVPHTDTSCANANITTACSFRMGLSEIGGCACYVYRLVSPDVSHQCLPRVWRPVPHYKPPLKTQAMIKDEYPAVTVAHTDSRIQQAGMARSWDVARKTSYNFTVLTSFA